MRTPMEVVMNSGGLNRKTKILLIGGLIGCAAGLAALTQSSGNRNKPDKTYG